MIDVGDNNPVYRDITIKPYSSFWRTAACGFGFHKWEVRLIHRLKMRKTGKTHDITVQYCPYCGRDRFDGR